MSLLYQQLCEEYDSRTQLDIDEKKVQIAICLGRERPQTSMWVKCMRKAVVNRSSDVEY